MVKWRSAIYSAKHFGDAAAVPILLHDLGGTLETDQPFHIISGYRTAATNALLRERGGASTGVASHSYWEKGKGTRERVFSFRVFVYKFHVPRLTI
jgi:hypothetical protein